VWAVLLCFLVPETFSLRLPLKARQTRTLSTSMGRLIHPSDRSSWRIPLSGNLTYWGEFYTLVGLGTPAQYIPVQVDTGSSDLIVYAKGCGNCNATVTFNWGASSTSQEQFCGDGRYHCFIPEDDGCDGSDPCQWEDKYGDGSTISGQVIDDMMTIGGHITTQQVSFGIINNVYAPNGFEAFGVDGIWGLAYADLCGWQETPSMDILVEVFSLYNSFDICLATGSGGNGGVLALGDNYASDKRFQWTAIQDYTWYTVYLNDWQLGGKTLGVSQYDLNYNGVIVDSGTTLLIIPSWVMTPLKKAFLDMCSTVHLVGICGVKSGQSLFDGQCYPMTAPQVAAFPPMQLAFPGINSLAIMPSDYLWQGAGVPGVYCMGVQEMGGGLPIILGDVLMQRYHVVFDRHQEKIGFGPKSSCP